MMKGPKDKEYLCLILHLKPFRSKVKKKDSASKKF